MLVWEVLARSDKPYAECGGADSVFTVMKGIVDGTIRPKLTREQRGEKLAGDEGRMYKTVQILKRFTH